MRKDNNCDIVYRYLLNFNMLPVKIEITIVVNASGSNRLTTASE